MVKINQSPKFFFLFFTFYFYPGESETSRSYQYVRREFDDFLEDQGDRFLCMIFGVCTIFSQDSFAEKPGLNPVFTWSQLEFDYATPKERQADIDAHVFIPGVPAPIDVDVHYSSTRKNRVFVSIPRFQEGSPAALGVITDKVMGNNPVIQPYPSWHWHRNPRNCGRKRIVSVYRVQIDECERLWVLDTGRLNEEQVCPPQILAFDLRTDELLVRYEIPANQLESRSILVTPMVDVRNPRSGCTDTFVYVADCQTYSIIVYDVRRNTSWRASDKTMYPYPNYGTFSIEGDSFDLMDGVLGMALSPFKPGEDRKLFYHAMSSPTENWVYTSYLRNQSRFIHDPASSPEIFNTYRGERNTQSGAEAMDKDGIMYFGLMSDVTINCWNTRTEYGPRNMEPVASNRQTLQFASGVKVINNHKGEQELWVLTSRFQKIATGTLSTSETNFRIQVGKVKDLVFGTTCKNGMGTRPHHHHGNGGGYGLYKPSTRVTSSVQSSTTKNFPKY